VFADRIGIELGQVVMAVRDPAADLHLIGDRSAVSAARDRLSGALQLPDMNTHGFCNEFGNLLGPSYRATFKNALPRADMPTIRCDDLRHTSTTILLAKGEHATLVSGMFWRAAIALTLDASRIVHRRCAVMQQRRSMRC
jgi:hypothetical protein